MGKYKTKERTRRKKLQTGQTRRQGQARSKAMEKTNKIKLQILIDETHINFNVFYAYLSQLKISHKKELILDIHKFSSYEELLSLKNNGQTILFMPRFCGINIPRLIDLIETKEFKYAAISTYWGVGNPYLCIVKDINLLKHGIRSTLKEENNYFNNQPENIMFSIYSKLIDLGDFNQILSKENSVLIRQERKNLIERLDNYCHLQSESIEGNLIESSIFSCWNDQGFNFNEFLEFFSNKGKEVYWNDKSYMCTLGESFFVSSGIHFAIVDKQKIYWDTIKNTWEIATGETLDQIDNFLTTLRSK